MRAHFLQIFFLYLLVHNSDFLENLIKNYCIRPHFDVVYCSMGWGGGGHLLQPLWFRDCAHKQK